MFPAHLLHLQVRGVGEILIPRGNRALKGALAVGRLFMVLAEETEVSAGRIQTALREVGMGAVVVVVGQPQPVLLGPVVQAHPALLSLKNFIKRRICRCRNYSFAPV
jgi:hypothetical protein